MPAELTLTPADYDVYRRIPEVWWDENVVGAEIAQRTNQRSGVVLRRIASFVRGGIVERRGGATIAAKTEIKRVGR
jgi:hypothetical protein